MASRTETALLKAKLKKQAKLEMKNKECFHIYGIYLNGECIYVGSTSRHYEERFDEHKKNLKALKHSNKSLQKKYIENSNFEYRLLCTIPIDNSLLQFFVEGLYNSLYTPVCNKVVIQQGRKFVTLSRLKDKEFVEYLINCVKDYFNSK